MTAPDEARVRADFDLWWTKGIDSRGPAGIGVYNEARDAYLAAARRYSAEADALRADIRSFQDGYHAIAAALGTTVPETNDEDLVDRIERLRAERDAEKRRNEAMIECAVEWGSENHTLAEWAEHARKRHATSERCDTEPSTPTPSPLTAARDAVVEAAMALADDWERPGINDPDLPARLRKRAREYRSLQQQADDPVREAREIVQRAVSGNMGRREAQLSALDLNTLRDLLTRALDRKP